MKTAEKILREKVSTITFDKLIGAPISHVISAMEAYAAQTEESVYNLFQESIDNLKPLEEIYRKEHPDPDGKFYIPDMTKLIKWAVEKIQKEGSKNS